MTRSEDEKPTKMSYLDALLGGTDPSCAAGMEGKASLAGHGNKKVNETQPVKDVTTAVESVDKPAGKRGKNVAKATPLVGGTSCDVPFVAPKSTQPGAVSLQETNTRVLKSHRTKPCKTTEDDVETNEISWKSAAVSKKTTPLNPKNGSAPLAEHDRKGEEGVDVNSNVAATGEGSGEVATMVPVCGTQTSVASPDVDSCLKDLVVKAENNKALFSNEANTTKIRSMYSQTKAHMSRSAKLEERFFKALSENESLRKLSEFVHDDDGRNRQ